MSASVSELEQLYRSRYRAFCRGLAPVCGSAERAHDAVQEAFARAISERGNFRGDGSLEGWVWRIACRTALNQTRKETTVSEFIEQAVVPVPDRDPQLAEAIRRLPGRRREVLFLRHFADMSYATIAELLEISEGTVAATLAHAHADLIACLTSEGVRA